MSFRWLLLMALPLAALFGAADVQTSVGIVGAVAVAALVAALAFHVAGQERSALFAPTTGPASDERCLHGSFRRQSSPDAPGRPQPRAPGTGLRPA
ncbi:DUF6412 domain-containing protein [Rhodococcoides trifolii]|uniref:DUF6412 domain-containing protein n=1 Tax=Rhodococcoides trifolii TaxID=908250 RepID=UPI00166AE309|nr:DUF6412 domain-containing protein [Rhodococcus trifolii]